MTVQISTAKHASVVVIFFHFRVSIGSLNPLVYVCIKVSEEKYTYFKDYCIGGSIWLKVGYRSPQWT